MSRAGNSQSNLEEKKAGELNTTRYQCITKLPSIKQSGIGTKLIDQQNIRKKAERHSNIYGDSK